MIHCVNCLNKDILKTRGIEAFQLPPPLLKTLIIFNEYTFQALDCFNSYMNGKELFTKQKI